MMTKEGYNKIVNLRTPRAGVLEGGRGRGLHYCVYFWMTCIYIFNKKIAIALRGYNAAFLFCDGPVDPFWQEVCDTQVTVTCKAHGPLGLRF